VNEELKGASYVTQILRNTAAIFTLTVLVISIAGMVFARYDPNLRETSSLFALAPLGLTYNTILQIAGGSVILAIIAAFLFSEQFFYKMRFLLRIVIFLSMTLIVFSLFAVFFKWLPLNEPMSWLGFFISTLVCFLISTGLTLVKFKLEGKKYSKLLESYKARHNISQ
jgi:cation transporter-like permease